LILIFAAVRTSTIIFTLILFLISFSILNSFRLLQVTLALVSSPYSRAGNIFPTKQVSF
jgi:hypothetical protein